MGPTGLLASGTHQGGCLTEIWGRAGERVPPPLVPGDVVTCEVEALGVVTNRVVDPDPCPPIPVARRRQPRGPRHWATVIIMTRRPAHYDNGHPPIQRWGGERPRPTGQTAISAGSGFVAFYGDRYPASGR